MEFSDIKPSYASINGLGVQEYYKFQDSFITRLRGWKVSTTVAMSTGRQPITILFLEAIYFQ